MATDEYSYFRDLSVFYSIFGSAGLVAINFWPFSLIKDKPEFNLLGIFPLLFLAAGVYYQRKALKLYEIEHTADVHSAQVYLLNAIGKMFLYVLLGVIIIAISIILGIYSLNFSILIGAIFGVLIMVDFMAIPAKKLHATSRKETGIVTDKDRESSLFSLLALFLSAVLILFSTSTNDDKIFVYFFAFSFFLLFYFIKHVESKKAIRDISWVLDKLTLAFIVVFLTLSIAIISNFQKTILVPVFSISGIAFTVAAIFLSIMTLIFLFIDITVLLVLIGLTNRLRVF